MVAPNSGGSMSGKLGCSAVGPLDGSVQVAVHAADQRLQHGHRLGQPVAGRAVTGQPLDQGGQAGNRVGAGGRCGRVPGLAQGGDQRRQGGLLADVDRHHDPAVGQLHAVAAALVDGEVGADVGPLLHQPHQTDGRVGAGLLVALGHEQQVAAGLEALPRQRRHRHRPGHRLVLHVDRAAAPQVAVLIEVAVERRVLPVLGVGGDDVGVAEQGQRRPLAAARDPGDQVGPLGITGDQLAGDPVRLQVVPEHHGGRCLPPGRVRGVDADQVAEQAGGLVAQGGVGHRGQAYRLAAGQVAASARRCLRQVSPNSAPSTIGGR